MLGDEDLGDNLEEATLNLKLTQQHGVKEDKDKEKKAVMKAKTMKKTVPKTEATLREAQIAHKLTTEISN